MLNKVNIADRYAPADFFVIISIKDLHLKSAEKYNLPLLICTVREFVRSDPVILQITI